MKLATYVGQIGERIGVVDGDLIYDLLGSMEATGLGERAWAADMLSLLAAGQDGLEAARASLEWARNKNGPELKIPLHYATLRAPLPCPGKLMCLAGNYASHIEEGGGSYIGKEKMIPRFFIKPCSSVTATGQPIRIPPSTGFADWELELAVVVGKRGRDLTPQQAEEHIMGYTIFNDISARELTFRNELPEQEGDLVLRLAGGQVARQLRTDGTVDHNPRRNPAPRSPAHAPLAQQRTPAGRQLRPDDLLARRGALLRLAVRHP